MAQTIRDYLESIISSTDTMGADVIAIRIRQTARAAIQQIDKELVGFSGNSAFSPETIRAMTENKELSANFQQTIDSYTAGRNSSKT